MDCGEKQYLLDLHGLIFISEIQFKLKKYTPIPTNFKMLYPSNLYPASQLQNSIKIHTNIHTPTPTHTQCTNTQYTHPTTHYTHAELVLHTDTGTH